jgi:hypothetical protein
MIPLSALVEVLSECSLPIVYCLAYFKKKKIFVSRDAHDVVYSLFQMLVEPCLFQNINFDFACATLRAHLMIMCMCNASHLLKSINFAVEKARFFVRILHLKRQ